MLFLTYEMGCNLVGLRPTCVVITRRRVSAQLETGSLCWLISVGDEKLSHKTNSKWSAEITRSPTTTFFPSFFSTNDPHLTPSISSRYYQPLSFTTRRDLHKSVPRSSTILFSRYLALSWFSSNSSGSTLTPSRRRIRYRPDSAIRLHLCYCAPIDNVLCNRITLVSHDPIHTQHVQNPLLLLLEKEVRSYAPRSLPGERRGMYSTTTILTT